MSHCSCQLRTTLAGYSNNSVHLVVPTRYNDNSVQQELRKTSSRYNGDLELRQFTVAKTRRRGNNIQPQLGTTKNRYNYTSVQMLLDTKESG